MTRHLLGCATTLVFVFNMAAATAQKSDRDRLAGAWKLVALEQPGADGKVNTMDCCGMFVFTRDGHLSVQVMGQAGSASDQYSRGGYEASWGTYVVNERNHTFTFHVEGALARDLVGKELPRRYTFDGDRLIVQSTRSEEHWRVVWVRY